MKISVIATVKNEGAVIRPLLDSLVKQTRQPDEIVICDGGSTDNTLDVVNEYRQYLPLKILIAPGTNISQGRNKAIKHAAGPIIASMDAGVVLSPDWLAELVKPIEEDGARVVSGWFEPDPQTPFEIVLGATILPALEDVEPEKFLPSSRSVAFTKAAWQAVGGYPEWLDYCEDLIFDLALRRNHGSFPFSPRAVAYFRPRQNLWSFARQYYLYARGDGKADLWPKRHAVRYLTYLVGLPVLGKLIWQGKLIGWIMLVLGGSVYCWRPAQRLWPAVQTWPWLARSRAFALIGLIRLVGDLAKMVGYPVGIMWRWQRGKGFQDKNPVSFFDGSDR
jgi:glycosyltransferase involved in cell wall biosynthesis